MALGLSSSGLKVRGIRGVQWGSRHLLGTMLFEAFPLRVLEGCMGLAAGLRKGAPSVNNGSRQDQTLRLEI